MALARIEGQLNVPRYADQCMVSLSRHFDRGDRISSEQSRISSLNGPSQLQRALLCPVSSFMLVLASFLTGDFRRSGATNGSQSAGAVRAA